MGANKTRARQSQKTPSPFAKRLYSQVGASFVIALGFLLICSVIAMLIIGSSSASAQHQSQDVQDEQSYYALSSALTQMRSIYYAQGPSEAKFSSWKTVSEDNEETTTGQDESAEITYASQESGSLAQWAAQQANTLLTDPSAKTDDYVCTISPDDEHAQSIPEVTLSCSFGSENGIYDIVMTAKLAESSTDYSYAAQTSTISSSISTATSTESSSAQNTTTTTTTTTVTWQQ